MPKELETVHEPHAGSVQDTAASSGSLEHRVPSCCSQGLWRDIPSSHQKNSLFGGLTDTLRRVAQRLDDDSSQEGVDCTNVMDLSSIPENPGKEWGVAMYTGKAETGRSLSLADQPANLSS